MQNDVHLKYLAKNPQDLLWGLAVNSVGFQEIGPREPYPPASHPARYLFSQERGRVLEEYQLLYIAEGRGRFTSSSLGRWVPVQAGMLFLLYPGEWHSYCPLTETGWKEYWIGFEGPVIDSRIQNGFFSKEKPLLQVGIREDIVQLYRDAIQVATEQKSGFQPLLGSIVVHLLGLGYFYDRREKFSEVEALVSRAKILIGEHSGISAPSRWQTNSMWGTRISAESSRSIPDFLRPATSWT